MTEGQAVYCHIPLLHCGKNGENDNIQHLKTNSTDKQRHLLQKHIDTPRNKCHAPYIEYLKSKCYAPENSGF